MHIDARQVHIVRIDPAARENRLLDLDDRDPSRHRHQRVEIALRAAEAEIAGCVGLLRSNKGVIERQRFFEHRLAETLTKDLDEARALLQKLADAGVDYDDVTETLEREGVQKFSDSFEELLDGIRAKRAELATA